MNLIVTDKAGNIKESIIRLHSCEQDACKYGRETYGFGRYVIHVYGTWKNSSQGRFFAHKLASLQRLRRFHKPSK